MSTVDVEDVTRHESGFVRSQEDDTLGDLLGESEPSKRNLRRQGRLILGGARETSQQPGVRGSRSNGVDTNPGSGDFERYRLGNAFDGVLGTDVNRGESRALVAAGRGDVDDAAAPLGLHGAHFMLHAQNHAEN